RTSQLHSLVWDTVNALWRSFTNSDSMALADPSTTRREIANMKRTIERLYSMRWEPEEYAKVVELKNTIEQTRKMVIEIQEEQKYGSAHWEIVDQKWYDREYEIGIASIKIIRSLISMEEKRIETSPAIIAKRRSDIEFALIVAIPIGIVLSFA